MTTDHSCRAEWSRDALAGVARAVAAAEGRHGESTVVIGRRSDAAAVSHVRHIVAFTEKDSQP